MAIPKQVKVSQDTLQLISEKYELTGAQINNATMYCCLQLAEKRNEKIELQDLRAAIKIEFLKEDKRFIE